MLETKYTIYVVSNGTTPEATLWVFDGYGEFVMNYNADDFREAYSQLKAKTGFSNLSSLPVYAYPNLYQETIISYERLLQRIDEFKSLRSISGSYK